MLGLHQDIQTRVREEVDSIFDTHPDSDDFTIEDIKQLKYLDCVLKEVQRLYPTAPFIGRELSEDTIISNLFLIFLCHHKNRFNFSNRWLFNTKRHFLWYFYVCLTSRPELILKS
jgi:hypothetical protein